MTMRALSPTDSAFLWMETRNQPMHVAGLNIYTPPHGSGTHFVHDLMQRWSKELKALPPFNLRPVLRMGLWYWEEDQEFELDYHLRHVALPQPGRIRELLSMVSRVHGNLMDRNRPLWEAYVIEGLPGGRFATYIKIHHALIDGVTGAKMMANSLALSADEDKPPMWAQNHQRSHPTARKNQQAPGVLEQLSALAKAGRELLPGVGSGIADMARSGLEETAAAMPFQAPPSAFNVEISGSRRFAAQSYSLARLKRIGEAAGATVNDVTLAICASALRAHLLRENALPKKPLVAMVPVSLHGETSEGGNQVSVLLANLATHIEDPLKRLQRIVQGTTEAKNRLSSMPRLQKMAHGITSISPMGFGLVVGTAKTHPQFNVVISNVPGPRDTLYLNGARLDEVYPVSIATHYLALNITIQGYGDKLGFGYTACRRSVPALQRMLDYTEHGIEELETALGLTTKAATVRKSKAAVTAAPPKDKKPRAAKTATPAKKATKTRKAVKA
ncbi:wax ester/triacylglycerol synthase family O-acyltransferase [Curvibacter sp. APW13]|uniref:wax ester/triacylglycerol synthase family O-acyltransferase n=1 Tax=Curvibacter sp. APW13 TaxID=3077236 RepID=UPI0028DE1973|nr:wax ester/triacylglycerol synthase family O-acyltransferase [Curvibacter sp. APW13]MDT8991697.1 wax ester/triacylglycerol synthase family O-acyltransferase [Curvibacter sp. APW13]